MRVEHFPDEAREIAKADLPVEEKAHRFLIGAVQDGR